MRDSNVEIMEFTYSQNREENTEVTGSEDKNAFLYGLIGFFIPIAGLVLYLAHEHDRPKCSAAAGVGFIINLLTMVALSFLLMVILLAGAYYTL